MRRLLLLLVVFCLAAGAGLAVMTLNERTSHPRVVDTGSGADMSDLMLRTDRHVTALDQEGLRPGARFRYSFRVTNSGDVTIRHVVVRSVKVAAPATGQKLTIVAISDPACWGVGHAECIFQRLEPGQTRTVHITAQSSALSRPGDRLEIRTFTGRFTRAVNGSTPLEVVGKARVTTGRFG